MKTICVAAALALIAFSATAANLDGKMLYQQNCASCHGNTAQGGTDQVKGPQLANDASKWSPKLFRRAVLMGVDDKGKKLESAMPHWTDTSFKSDQGKAPSQKEIDAIHHYLRTLK